MTSLKQLISSLVLLTVLAPLRLSAHEGHDAPGGLPPAPNGGVVGEASHKVAHAADAAEEELFFEVVVQDKTVKVFPLALDPKNTSVYKKLSPSDLAKMELKAEFPRTKKTESLKVTAGADAFEAPFDSKGANRFFIHVNATQKNEVKTAKIQVEKK